MVPIQVSSTASNSNSATAMMQTPIPVRRKTSSLKAASTPAAAPEQQAQQPVIMATPPDSAVRMRCYRLNLDSSIPGMKESQQGGGSSQQQLLSSSQHQHHCGPIEYRRSRLVASMSEDSSVAGGASSTNMAHSTAQIFRGMTIARDGTVRSKKSRGSRGNSEGGKVDKKSRQAAKIDKAKDLVEQCGAKKKKGGDNGSTSTEEDDSNMVSLVIMGEYDGMKHLVRDGSKRLKDSEGLPNDALLSVNHQRNHRRTICLRFLIKNPQHLKWRWLRQLQKPSHLWCGRFGLVGRAWPQQGISQHLELRTRPS